MEAAAFPKPRCATCADAARCERAGRADARYPRCHAPLLGVRLDRTTELLAFCRRTHGIADAALEACTSALVDRFAADRNRWSEVLEPSFSVDGEGVHLARFSYGLPGFRADPAGVGRTIEALCAPFGDAAIAAGGAFVRAAERPAVEQPLFGVAHDGARGVRVKLYLQFDAGAPAAATATAAAVLGARRLATSSAPLHLLGLDVGPRGLAGAKLYHLHPRVSLSSPPAWLGRTELVDALAARGVAELRDVLAIHRLDGPDDAGAGVARELDFSLPDNDLGWPALRALAPVARLLPAGGPVDELFAAFRLGVRRVSASVGPLAKLNAYYVLGETEAARGAA